MGVTGDTIFALLSRDYPFHINVISSNIGPGCIRIQQFQEVKRIFFHSRVYNKAEQKMSAFHRGCAVIFASQAHEFSIIGSPFPIYFICDHNPTYFTYGAAKDNCPTDLRVPNYDHEYSETKDHMETWI